MIDLRQMRHAVVLARSGSYVAAAQALAMTQPALTRSIQAIEAHYGVRLFDRGRGGAVLTDAGQEFVTRAQVMLQDAQMLDEGMKEQRAGISGEVRFGLGPLIASAALPKAMPAILAAYPAIELRIVVTGGATLLEQLAANMIQFAICSHEIVTTSAHVVTALGRLPLWVVARAGHPLAGRRVTFEEASGFPQIGGSAADRQQDARTGEDHPPYRPRLICDNYEILRGITAASDALWITSPAVAAHELAEGSMIRVDCPELLDDSYEVVLVTRRRGAMSGAAQRVMDHLRTVLEPDFLG